MASKRVKRLERQVGALRVDVQVLELRIRALRWDVQRGAAWQREAAAVGSSQGSEVK